MPVINFYNEDCMSLMARTKDKFYKLAIVDTPYGIGEGSKKILSRHYSQKKYHLTDWDNNCPDMSYFKELMRVSTNQIIWGANHFIDRFSLNSSCWIFWDKGTEQCDFADGELAWTSFTTAVKKFTFTWNGFRQGYVYKCKEDRIHPTQKPVQLYRWLLQNYAKPGDNILDTHGGSMSIAIACDMEGFDLDICEIDREYFEAGVKRFNLYKSQGKLF